MKKLHATELDEETLDNFRKEVAILRFASLRPSAHHPDLIPAFAASSGTLMCCSSWARARNLAT